VINQIRTKRALSLKGRSAPFATFATMLLPEIISTRVCCRGGGNVSMTKTPIWPAIIMTIGVALIAIGLYFLLQWDHPLRAYGAIGVGAVVIVAGIVSLFLAKEKGRSDTTAS
jgi:hypothetical protein